MKSLIVIKLGGSVITYKESKTPKVRITEILRLAVEVAQLVKSEKYRIIIVHGGGSFAHPIAKKNNLHKGMKTAQQRLAYAKTAQNMLDLNEFVVKSLITKSVPAVSFPPHSFITQRAGKFKDFDYRLIKKCLKEEQLPVIFGDAVLDDVWGCSILSGDVICSYLAKKLNAEKLIFLSDIDGIFTQDPKSFSSAKLIPFVNNANYKDLITGVNHDIAKGHNVTGEMSGKIETIRKNLKNVRVFVVNGFKANVLKSILGGKKEGTELYFR